MTRKSRAPRSGGGKGHNHKKPAPQHNRLSRTSSLRRKKGDANNEANNNPDEQLFSVEKIVDCKMDKNGVPTYKTRWTGYSASEDTWEPYENVVSTGHVDWYERKQRQHTLKEDSVGVAVIEYEDGEFEMVDLRTEKFRSYRSDDDDVSISSDSERREDVNNFGLIAEGEWIEIFWKHAKIYFPCKIISWSPLRATRRTALNTASNTITLSPATSRTATTSTSEDVKGSSTRETRRSSQTSKQGMINSEKLNLGIRMANRQDKNEEPTSPSLQPAKKPTKIEPNETHSRIKRQRGDRVKNQLEATIPIRGESKQRIADSTGDAPPNVGEAVNEPPRKQLKRQGGKLSAASFPDAEGATVKKKSKLEEQPLQQSRTESAHQITKIAVPQLRVLRDRNKDKKSQQTTTSSSFRATPANNKSTIIPSTMLAAAETEGKPRSQKMIVPDDQAGKQVVAPLCQDHHKRQRGNLLNQSAEFLVAAGLLETEASEQEGTTTVLRDSGGLQHKDDAKSYARLNCSSPDSNSNADESSSSLLRLDDDDDEDVEDSSDKGIPLYDEPEDDFDSSSVSDMDDYDDDEDEENDSDEDHRIIPHHFPPDDDDDNDDGSDDNGVNNDGKRMFAYQVEGPKLTFEEQWMLKLKRTQELTFR